MASTMNIKPRSARNALKIVRLASVLLQIVLPVS